MGRRSRSSNHQSRNVTAQRDPVSTIATRSVLHPTLTLNHLLEQQHHALRTRELTQAPTRKRFHPLTFTPITTLAGSPARLNHNRLRTLYQSPFEIARPDKVGICVRRKERREVLHALNRTGKGARAKRRLTDTSKFHC